MSRRQGQTNRNYRQQEYQRFGGDRLRKGDAAKEKGKRQRDAARAGNGAKGKQAEVVGWTGGVAQ